MTVAMMYLLHLSLLYEIKSRAMLGKSASAEYARDTLLHIGSVQERRKQQRRFRDAQLIQREMSQLERQYEELEEVGRHIEQALRDAEDSEFGGWTYRGRYGVGRVHEITGNGLLERRGK